MSHSQPSRLKLTCVMVVICLASLPVAERYMKLLGERFGPLIAILYALFFAILAMWRINPLTLNQGPSALDDTITTLGDLGKNNSGSSDRNKDSV